NKMDLIQKLKEYSSVTNRGKGKEKETLASTSNLGQEVADNASITSSNHTEISAVLDINPEAQTLRDLLQNERRTTWGIPLENLSRNAEERPGWQPQVDREPKKRKSLAEEGPSGPHIKLQCAKFKDSDWLFENAYRKHMTTGTVTSIVKKMACHAGLDGRYSGHSLRIGGATGAMKAGLTLPQIMSIGGWLSQSVALYLRSFSTVLQNTSTKMGF
ncbi:30971_t:CDS:2, partial [Gigaspora margarita]